MPGADTTKDDDVLEEAREAFDLAAEAESRNRLEAAEDLRFARLGEQWPEKIRKERELEGRPCLTINRMPAFIRQVVNDARQNKPAIIVHPVDSGADPETAEVLNGLIRHIEQSSDAEVAYDTALDFAVTGGFGYFRINTRYATDDAFEQDIVVERIANPFAVYGDPSSTAVDSSDWNSAFVLDAMPKKVFEKRWKGCDAVSFEGEGNKADLSEDRVQIAEQWTREEVSRQIVALSAPTIDNDEALEAAVEIVPDSMIVDLDVYQKNKELFDALGVSIVGKPRDVPSHKVTQRLLSGCEVLEAVEWAGRWIPIVPVYGEEINVEGERFFRSLIRDAKDPARMFNYWRTTSTELVALAPKAPFIGKVGQFATDVAKWGTANTQTHAYIEYDDENGAGAPQRQPFAGVPAGALQEALNASDDIKSVMGLYDAALGARSNETSGKAIIARQREGDVSTFHFIDNLSRAIRHGGRIIVDLIPHVISTPRIIRTLGKDGAAQTVRVAPGASPKASEQRNQAEADAPQPATMTEEQDQAQKIERVFDLTVGKYDVTVTAGPSYTTQREEAASQMIELIRAYPAAAPLIGDLLAKNLDWPGADEIAKRLQAMLPAQIHGESPEAQQAQAQMKQMSEIIGQLKGKLAAAEADQTAANKDREVDAFNAETARLKAMAPKGVPMMDAEGIQAMVLKTIRDVINSPDLLTQAGPAGDASTFAGI
jgi:hypothetical protein